MNFFFPPFSFGENVDVKFDCVVCELVELVKVFGKVLVREKVPPLASLKHDVDVAVAVLEAFPMPALIAVVFIPILAGETWQINWITVIILKGDTWMMKC